MIKISFIPEIIYPKPLFRNPGLFGLKYFCRPPRISSCPVFGILFIFVICALRERSYGNRKYNSYLQ